MDEIKSQAYIDALPREETTICNTMHCYNRALDTKTPGKPAFCPSCQLRWREKHDV